jgi:hypothetical protein
MNNPVALIILIGSFQLLISLLSNGFVLSFDESIWDYIGRNWIYHHMVPYGGGVDNKSPFIFLIFGISDLMFGVNYWFPRVIGTICETIGMFYVYKIADRAAGKDAGILTLLFYGLSLLWHATGGKYVDFTETFEVMFFMMSVYKYLLASSDKDFIMSGLCSGLALDFRLTAAFGILAIVISCLKQKSIRSCWLFLAGTLGGILILLATCFLAGIKLHDLWTYGFFDNFGPGSVTSQTLSQRFESFLEKFIYSPIAIFYPLLIIYILEKKKLDLFTLWYLLAFSAISLVGIFDVVHLKDILPPLSLMAGIGTEMLLRKYRVPFTIGILFIFILFFPSTSEMLANARIILNKTKPSRVYGSVPYVNPDEGDRKLLAEWVKQHTKTTDMVLVHSYGTQIQVYSERLSPTVYFSINRTPFAKDRFYKDLNRHHPELILVPMFDEYQKWVDADQRNFVQALINKNYVLSNTFYNYKIYRICKSICANHITTNSKATAK